MEENKIALQRDIETVTGEIILLRNQAQSMAVSYAIELGRKLTEAKSLLKHGEWGEWLKNRVEFSQSSANDFMKMYEEYGDSQISLFSSNLESLGNLSYTKVLKLLAVPREEREAFVEENDVENISTRKLDELIKERDEAIKAQKEAERKAEQFALAQQRASKAEKDLTNAQQKVNELNSQLISLQNSLDKAQKSEKQAKENLKQAKENPTIPQELLDSYQAEAEKKAASDLEAKTAELRQQLEEAEKAKKQAEAESLAAQHKIAELDAKIKMSDPDMMEFKQLFQQIQEIMLKLSQTKDKIKSKDEAQGEKLEQAISMFARQYLKE